MNENSVLLSGQNITKIFGYSRSKVYAVDDVSFAFHKGEIISLVGESGSGKTTLAKIILGLLNHTSGDIQYKGEPRNLRTLDARRQYWKDVQGIFQDPYSSFNQFFRVERVLLDCIKLGGWKLTEKEKLEKMKESCGFVNLEFEELYNKYPFELSGGQMQRLMIARIFMLNPKVLIADEPTSMVDACLRSAILKLLLDLRTKNDMMILFITHDLGLAYYVSDTICIMKEGKIIERENARDIIIHPKNAYTKQLIEDVPKLNKDWDLS
jgi:peptide/nickel transport system ATP-binding protein